MVVVNVQDPRPRVESMLAGGVGVAKRPSDRLRQEWRVPGIDADAGAVRQAYVDPITTSWKDCDKDL